MLFSYCLLHFYEASFVNQHDRSHSSLGNHCMIDSGHFIVWRVVRPVNISCASLLRCDAKAQYWTASMLINSNFSSISFWPPINPWGFVIQNWDVFQHYRAWHFKTISVPTPFGSNLCVWHITKYTYLLSGQIMPMGCNSQDYRQQRTAMPFSMEMHFFAERTWSKWSSSSASATRDCISVAKQHSLKILYIPLM